MVMTKTPPQMTPKTKRKSILVRMLRPISVAFGELEKNVSKVKTCCINEFLSKDK